jgi:hypothetical protein
MTFDNPNLRFSVSTVIMIANAATVFTTTEGHDPVARLESAGNPGDGIRYTDGSGSGLVWAGKFGAKAAAAFYTGAAFEWSRLTGLPLPQSLRIARGVLGTGQPSQRFPPSVREAYRAGRATASAAFAKRRTAKVGETMQLTRDNRTAFLAWCGGRLPEALHAPFLTVDNPGGSTVLIGTGGTLELTEHGFRIRTAGPVLVPATTAQEDAVDAAVVAAIVAELDPPPPIRPLRLVPPLKE